MHLFVSVIICLILSWLYLRWRDRRFLLLARYFPSVKNHMLFGFGDVVTQKTIIEQGVRVHQEIGLNALVYMGPYPSLVTADPVIIKDVLNTKLCINKSELTYQGVNNACARGLINLEGNEWIQHRKLLNEPFKLSNQLTFLPIFNKQVNTIFVDMDKLHHMENAYYILGLCREFTVKIASETMLSHDITLTDIDVRHYAQLFTRNMEYLSEITFNFIYFNPLILKIAHMTKFKECRKDLAFLTSQFNEILDNFSTGKYDPSYVPNLFTAIHCLNDELKNKRITHERLISSMVQLYCAAFETTSSTIYFCILMLAMYPEFQAKAYAEVCELFPEDDEGEFEVTYEDLSKLTYVDMFVKETMRLLPTIPQTGRTIRGGDLKLSNGVVLPEGLDIGINIYYLHRNKEIWGPNANAFNPDNFLPCNVEKRHSYAFIPFMKGSRFCIGMRYAEMSLKVAMSKLIKRYKFTSAAKLEDFQLENHISLYLVNTPSLTIERRVLNKI